MSAGFQWMGGEASLSIYSSISNTSQAVLKIKNLMENV